MILHLLRLLHLHLRPVLRTTALLLRHHALQALLHLLHLPRSSHSLLHLRQPHRAQLDVHQLTRKRTLMAASSRILHSLGSTSLRVRRVSKARSTTRSSSVEILFLSGSGLLRHLLLRRQSPQSETRLRSATLPLQTL